MDIHHRGRLCITGRGISRIRRHGPEGGKVGHDSTAFEGPRRPARAHTLSPNLPWTARLYRTRISSPRNHSGRNSKKG